MEQYKNKYWDENRDVKITVLTPTYNRKDTLLRTIRSIENQDFLDWEYIIVNDGSTDNTDEVVEQFMQTTKHPVLYIKKENGGVHTARNLGYKNAHGELLINLDSDDEMLPDALKIIWSVWKKIPKQEKPNTVKLLLSLWTNKERELENPSRRILIECHGIKHGEHVINLVENMLDAL